MGDKGHKFLPKRLDSFHQGMKNLSYEFLYHKRDTKVRIHTLLGSTLDSNHQTLMILVIQLLGPHPLNVNNCFFFFNCPLLRDQFVVIQSLWILLSLFYMRSNGWTIWITFITVEYSFSFWWKSMVSLFFHAPWSCVNIFLHFHYNHWHRNFVPSNLSFLHFLFF